MENQFYESQTPSSLIKAKIVAEYFPKYCRILLKTTQPEIRYLDLFAGPGKYDDGSHSTPLLLSKTCADDASLSQKVHLFFNDKKYSDELKTNFNECFPKGTFAFEPKFGDKTVGKNDKIKDYLSRQDSGENPHPTLLFFDPWGYKGIDTLVLAKFLSNWGNEIFLFVNIKRIHAAIENDKFDDLMKSLFPTTIDEIKNDRKYKTTVYDRLTLIMDNLASEFQKALNGTLYHCAFKFQEEDSVATSHFIIHFTKHPKGYELVKQIYYGYDNIGATLERDGVYTFDAKRMLEPNDSSFDFGDQNIKDLSAQISEKYKGRSINARQLFDEHQTTTQYCGTHYVRTLRYMEEKNLLEAEFTDDSNHQVTVLLIESCNLNFN
ncbi:MAG: three-Cys-motif partner protein TcmP [Bacteroidetes bacterium]|nr:three-Cys-motif partner protein TcmP [Bacteroidota bacterium]